MTDRTTILALDVGDKRIGLALADTQLRFANPLKTLDTGGDLWTELKQIIQTEQVVELVVGLPRGLDGQETAQTQTVRAFIEQLQANIDLPITMQDEATTSVKAEAELQARGKPYEKSDIDALAATYILEDYLQDHGA